MSLKVWRKKCKVRRGLRRFLFLPILLGVFFHCTILLANPEEELTNLPQFSGITLAKNGNLILAEGNTKGIYISKLIPTPFPARIIIPSFTVGGSDSDETITLDVSADGGTNYKTDCKSGSYYYASRGDFTSGSNLRYRLVIARSEATPALRSLGEVGKQSPQLSELSIDYRSGNILLVSPNGGELWPAGRRRKILWRASDYEPTYLMRIEYSLDRGKTYKAIKEKTKNTGAYTWRIPRKLSGKEVIIKVSDALDGSVCDVSDGTLEIR